jgi:hypothetical protein
MPPRNRNNQLPPPVEPPLPALDPGEDAVPLDDMDTMNGVSAMDYDYGTPEEVANDLPAETVPETGMGFDFSKLNVQTREDFDALPVEQQELLKAMKRGVQFTPEGAAQFVLKQQQARQDMQQRQAFRDSDPRVAAQVESTQQATQQKAREAAEAKQAKMDEIGRMRSVVTQMLDHPGFSGSVGAKNFSYLFGLKNKKLPDGTTEPDPFAGTEEANFKAMLDQVKGGAFLEAFKALKGGGQITEIEGKKATDATARLSQSQSEDGFKKSMNELLEVLDKAENRVKMNEVVDTPAAAAPQFKEGLTYRDAQGRLGIYRGMVNGKPKFDEIK